MHFARQASNALVLTRPQARRTDITNPASHEPPPSGGTGRLRGTDAQVPGRSRTALPFVARLLVVALALLAAGALASAIAPHALAADPTPPPTDPAPVPPPVATIAITGTVHFAGEPVALSDTSTGEITGRTWAFGDGESSSHREPSHTYADPGSYTVTLTVEGPGGTAVATAGVRILGPWTGTVQLYTPGSYSKQATMRLCVAASTQMIRNMIFAEQDHSLRYQSAYNAYGRAHNGYRTPASDGVDPAGWQAMLRRYVHPSYRIVASATYGNAMRAAARAIRLTGRPVGVFVAHGSHVWVISGFTATADPAITAAYTITSLNVEGPLWGVRPPINGFDQSPNIRMSLRRLSRYVTPYRDPYEPKGWRNRYVVVVP